MKEKIARSWLTEELQGVSLPDKRFKANVISIAEHLNEHTGVSFSAACGERLRKSAWRLFSVEELDLLQVHQQNTFARCTNEETILIAEDTTDICYRQPHKQGMGELGGSNFRSVKGLNMHTALAMNTSGQPLGIVHQKIWAPKADKAGIQRHHFAIEDKETIKWINTLKAVGELWQTSSRKQRVVLIADREADFFEHYAQPKAENIKLLVRVQQKKRRVLYNQQDMNLAKVLCGLPSLGEGTVKAWRRQGEPERTVVVEYYATTVMLPPAYKQKQPCQTMQLVCVKERSAEAADKLEWVLLTNLQVDSLEEAVMVCDYYSCRWTVERFHYILKSGLLIEQLQMDSFLRLMNALQLYALIAWHLLWLQRLAREQGDKPATDYIDQQTIEIIETVSNRRIVTVAEFMVATAVLGGFIPTKKQPLPGEKTLWTGLHQLCAITKGFLAAKQKYGTG
jgi:hypothetical protein